MHLDEERLQRLLDDQLDPTSEASVRAHLDSCVACRRLHESLRRSQVDAAQLLDSLDYPVNGTPLSVEEIIARAERRERVPDPPSRSSVRWMRLAAGIGLAILAVGAAYAAPGSPIRGWIDGLVRSVTTEVEPPQPETAPASSPQSPVSGAAGIAVTPGTRLTIEFPGSATGSTIRIRLVDGDRVLVRAPEDAASFTTGDGRILIGNVTTPVRFEIDLPRLAPRVELSQAGRSLFLMEGPRIITTAQSSPDSTWQILLGP